MAPQYQIQVGPASAINSSLRWNNGNLVQLEDDGCASVQGGSVDPVRTDIYCACVIVHTTSCSLSLLRMALNDPFSLPLFTWTAWPELKCCDCGHTREADSYLKGQRTLSPPGFPIVCC